jgi:DNA-binding IclR family transcriptional regulator
VGSWKKFKSELVTARELGYAIDKEEDEIGGRCVAAPIFNGAGVAVAAIGLSGIVSQISDERIPLLGQTLRSAAELISTRLGYRPARPQNGEVNSRRRKSAG